MDIRAILTMSPLFARLVPEALDALIQCVTRQEIKSGQTLFNEGDPAEVLYIVASGRMRAVMANGAIAGDIGRGEPIGEIGLLAGESRGATVYAVRDSLLLCVRRDDLSSIILRYPQSLLEVTRVIIKRLRQNQNVRKLESARSSRVFALIPASPDVDVMPVARAMHAAFARQDRSRILDRETVEADLGPGSASTRFEEAEANERLLHYLAEQESNHQYLVYCAGREPDPWSRRCMGQADRVLLVAHSETAAAATPMVTELRRSGSRAPVECILLRPEGAAPGDVLGWRNQASARAHYFVRPESPRDINSLSRQLTGRGIGLVLGGGGARGFAHLGLIRALHELDIPIDVVGGSSMGAFFSALVASGYGHNEMAHIARETFVKRNYLNDYVFPTVAMIRGRKFVRRMQDIFGDRQIEQLRMPFFCVSSNLTRGGAVVHDRGPLYMWLATSMCVPGVAPPVAYKGELLVDGAVCNSLPTDVMQGLERGPIIASDVSTEGDLRVPGVEGPDPEALFRWKSEGKRPGLFSIIFRTATLTSDSSVSVRAQRADLYIRMPVTGVALFDWKRMDEIIERGYRVSMEKLTAMRSQLVL